MRYRGTFTKAELISAATVGVVAGAAAVLGKYAVQAGEAIKLGFGNLSGQENAIGRLYMQFKDTTGTPVLLSGTVRLSIWSPQDRPIAIIGEWRTEQLDTVATDRTKQIPMPEDIYKITEDKKVVLEFISDTTATLSKANSTIVMDITRFTA
jgi:hypothetical protein